MAIRVVMSPITPAIENTRAMPLPAPTPYHLPIKSTPLPVVIKGMKINCAIGPIIKAVIGDAACSTLCAKPNTRPCRSGGTTF